MNTFSYRTHNELCNSSCLGAFIWPLAVVQQQIPYLVLIKWHDGLSRLGGIEFPTNIVAEWLKHARHGSNTRNELALESAKFRHHPPFLPSLPSLFSFMRWLAIQEHLILQSFPNDYQLPYILSEPFILFIPITSCWQFETSLDFPRFNAHQHHYSSHFFVAHSDMRDSLWSAIACYSVGWFDITIIQLSSNPIASLEIIALI